MPRLAGMPELGTGAGQCSWRRLLAQDLTGGQRVDVRSQGSGLSFCIAHHEVLRRDVARFLQNRCAHQIGQGMQGIGLEVLHPLGLVGHHHGALAHRVLCGHAGGAVVGVAAA